MFKPNLRESILQWLCERAYSVQLLAGGLEETFGDRRFIKKIKTRGMNLGLMMQTLENRKKADNRA